MRTSTLALALLVLLCVSPRLRAQDPLTQIGLATQVHSIAFRFEDGSDIRVDELRAHISLTPTGSLAGVRRFFGFLPFISPVGAHPFDPLELQRDVIRIRNYCRESGFPRAEARYEVTYHAKDDNVNVTFVVKEGPPLLIRTLAFTGDSGGATLPEELEAPWSDFVGGQQKNKGRLSRDKRKELADSTWRWFRSHGYPFAISRSIVNSDTVAMTADVTVQTRSGTRARIDSIEVTGIETVPARHIARQLPVKPGDWYDGSALERGREQLTQMDIVRLALLEPPKPAPADSSVIVPLKVTENPPHLLRSEVGAQSGGGLSTQTEWVDRSVFGGLRTFTVTATAQTGLLALESPSQQLYRLGLSMFLPYVGSPRISLAGGPFVEYRNDVRDRSLAAGLGASMVYAPAPLRSISLGYTVSHRRIYNYGFGDNLDPIVYLPILGLALPAGAGALESTRDRSVITLEGSYGKLDRITNPRRGYVLRPRLEITTPYFNTSEYFLLDMNATAFVPLTRKVGFTFRSGGGRLFPYGNSVTSAVSESPFLSLLRLRDVAFTAGGTRDVRGWGSQLVGPKLPEVRFQDGPGGTVDTVADRYAPVGGLARLVGSAELQLPLPGFGDAWRGFLFLDGGRIWTPDNRFALGAGELDQDKFYAAAGAGIGYQTIVGAVQVAVGYKLNPSPLDLRSPSDVLRALSSGEPIDPLPTSGRRRLHLHFSIGSTF
ncbi:MAG: BamA/TamA family outer membrane protein [Gemmatimonadales bacterium]